MSKACCHLSPDNHHSKENYNKIVFLFGNSIPGSLTISSHPLISHVEYSGIHTMLCLTQVFHIYRQKFEFESFLNDQIE